MKNITIIGEIIGNSGYANHVRNLSKAFLEKGWDIKNISTLSQGWEIMVEDWLFNSLRKEDKKELYLYIGMPQFNRYFLNENPKQFIQYCVWEGKYVPKYWEKYLEDDRVEQIWVPSTHVQKAIDETFKNINISQKIRIVSHGVDTSKFYPFKLENTNPNSKPKEKFNFLLNKGLKDGENDRGGVLQILKAFRLEFNEKEPVELLCKINSSYAPREIIEQQIKNTIKDIKGAQIKVLYDNLTEKQLNEFYHEGDVFINGSKAEGFSLPTLEAMACNLPIITTTFGGQTDYCNEKNSLFVNGIMFEVKHDITYEGNFWCEPSIEELRKAMRWCFENQNKLISFGNESLNITKNYTWQKTVEKAEECLKELK